MFSASSEEKNKKLEIKAGSKDSIFWTLFPSLKKKKIIIIITALSSVHNSAAVVVETKKNKL